MRKQGEEKEKKWLVSHWSHSDLQVSKINDRHQTTNSRSSRNTKQDKYQTHTPKYSLNFRKLKLSWKPRKKHLIYGGAKVRVTSTSLNYTNNKKVEWSISSVMRTKFTNLKCFARWTSFKVEGEIVFLRQTKI